MVRPNTLYAGADLSPQHSIITNFVLKLQSLRGGTAWERSMLLTLSSLVITNADADAVLY
jgi:hypothetical protein